MGINFSRFKGKLFFVILYVAMSSDSITARIRAAREASASHNYDEALILFAQTQQEILKMAESSPSEEKKLYWLTRLRKLQNECNIVLRDKGELEEAAEPIRAPRPSQNREGGPRNCEESKRCDARNRGFLGETPIRNLFAAKNQILYGDPDRFGPPLAPEYTPVIPGIPMEDMRMAMTGKARNALPSKRKATTRNAGVRRTERDGAPFHSLPEKTKAEVGRRTREKTMEDTINGHPRFIPRSGDEKLAEAIECDLHFGQCDVSWDDIGGLVDAKRLLEEAVVYPILMPSYYQGIRRPWKGVLLYGPPGTGKTMLAKAVASECNTTFFNISPASLTSKWHGESEKLIRVLFEMARHYAPSTVFIDEIDSLCGQRGGSGEHEATRRAKGTLLAQMDGVGTETGNKVVMVLGATNHPWDIDEAMWRRLEKRIYIPLPTKESRSDLFRINTKSVKLSDDVDFDKLSEMLEGKFYSGADITGIVREAAMMTMRRFLKTVNKNDLKTHGNEIGEKVAEQPTTMSDFVTAISKVPSSINVDNIKKFESFEKNSH